MQGLCLVGLGNAEGCQLACHSPNPQASEALTLSWGSCPPGPSQGELGHLWALTTTASYPQERKVLPKPQARRPRQDPADRKIEPKRKRGGMGCGCPSRNLPISSFRTTRRDGPLTGPPPTSPIWLNPSFRAGMGTPSSTCSEGALCWPTGAHTRTGAQRDCSQSRPHPAELCLHQGRGAGWALGTLPSGWITYPLGAPEPTAVSLPISPSPPASHPQATICSVPLCPLCAPWTA